MITRKEPRTAVSIYQLAAGNKAKIKRHLRKYSARGGLVSLSEAAIIIHRLILGRHA